MSRANTPSSKQNWRRRIAATVWPTRQKKALSSGKSPGELLPTTDPANRMPAAAAALFHQEQARPKMVVWAMTGYELVRGEFSPCGDHAGKWETSLLMHLDPGMQNLSLLPCDPDEKPVGASNNGVREANAEFGRQATSAIVQAVRTRVEEFLKNTGAYQGHGSPMWRAGHGEGTKWHGA